MTPGARTQAAIDLVDVIAEAARSGGAAADTLIARWFATRRYAGSKDRRAVRELVYAAIRRAGEVPANGRTALVALADDDATVAASFDGSNYGPAPIVADEPRASAGVAPRWLEQALIDSGLTADALPALVGRAPLDLRVNTLKATRDEVLAELPDAAPIGATPDGVRLPTGTAVEALPAFNRGLVEVQDAGSQIVGLALPVAPGARIVDLCAGAGGKTLALAARMGGEGMLLACDTDRNRLQRLAPRATRAGAGNVETRLLNPGRELESLPDWIGTADGVLVDAPCSGTGTWRRNPEARSGWAPTGSTASARRRRTSSTWARRWCGRVATSSTSSARSSMRKDRRRSTRSLRGIRAGPPRCSTSPPVAHAGAAGGSIPPTTAPTAFSSRG